MPPFGFVSTNVLTALVSTFVLTSSMRGISVEDYPPENADAWLEKSIALLAYVVLHVGINRLLRLIATRQSHI